MDVKFLSREICWISPVAQSCPTICNPMDCGMPGFPVHHQLPELAHAHFHQVGDAIQPSYPLSSPSPPAFNVSQHQGLFQWVGSSNQVAKVLELQHQSLQWIFRIDSFRIDWFDLLAVQGTLKSLQHHSSKASILWCSAFFMVQLLHSYMTIGKTVTLTIWTFVGTVMSLLFNMLSRFVIVFLPRSKCLNFMAAVTICRDFGAWENKVTVSIVSPSICHGVMGVDVMILVFGILSFKSAFPLSSFTFIKKLFSSYLLSAVRVVSSAYVRLTFSWQSWFHLVIHPTQYFAQNTLHIS